MHLQLRPAQSFVLNDFPGLGLKKSRKWWIKNRFGQSRLLADAVRYMLCTFCDLPMLYRNKIGYPKLGVG